MRITIDNAPYFTVKVVQGEEELHFTPKEAYEIWKGLHAQHMHLYDLATNFYECTECGGLHRNGMSHKDVMSEEEGEQ